VDDSNYIVFIFLLQEYCTEKEMKARKELRKSAKVVSQIFIYVPIISYNVSINGDFFKLYQVLCRLSNKYCQI